jgi:hypothetical protein
MAEPALNEDGHWHPCLAILQGSTWGRFGKPSDLTGFQSPKYPDDHCARMIAWVTGMPQVLMANVFASTTQAIIREMIAWVPCPHRDGVTVFFA